jgi:hypothetical protein
MCSNKLFLLTTAASILLAGSAMQRRGGNKYDDQAGWPGSKMTRQAGQAAR